MFGALFRIVFGFLIAAIAAAAVMVGFAGGYRPGASFAETAELVLLTATHSALFAGPFVLIAAGISEWQHIRAWLYYAFGGALISLLGFVAQGASEVGGQGTIFNSYAGGAYVLAGLAGGLVYWVLAGRRAGGRGADRQDDDGLTFAPEDTSAMQARLPAPDKTDEAKAGPTVKLEPA